MFRFEDRPTSIVTIGKLAMGAVFAGVVLLLFVAPLIVRHDLRTLSVGDEVSVLSVGGRAGEFPRVVEIGIDTVTVRTPDGVTVTVPIDEVSER